MFMSNRATVPNPGIQGSRGNRDSPSGGGQVSRARLASHNSTPHRADRRYAPYKSGHGGARPVSHESTPTSRRRDIATSHGSPPTSRAALRGSGIPSSHEFSPIISGHNTQTLLPPVDIRRLAEDHVDPVHVEPVGGYVELLQQMNTEGVHFSDEDYNEGEEDGNGDGEATPHGSNNTHVSAYGAYGTSQRTFINCVGKKFERFKVHRAIRQLIDQYSDGPWISSKHIPKEVIEQMWGCFKTLYVWDQTEDTRVKNNFKFVIKERYRDIMKEHREKSAKLAIAAGHDISEKGKDFDIMKDFVPRAMQAQAWEDMCRVSGLIQICYCLFPFLILYIYYSLQQWNTEAWLKRSASGTSNRNTTDGGGNISRHTGGSIGYDEHRIKLTAQLGRPPRFLELFFQTHLDKASKMKYLDGDDTGKKFCTETARELYEAYSRALLEKYGDDLHDQIDDAELWAKTQKEIRGASKK